MKTKRRFETTAFVLAGLLLAFCAHGQGTFVYDQQSSDESNISGGIPIQTSQPLGQSFTPNLSSVGFIRLFLFDLAPSNGLGATIAVNLRTNSITGPVLAFTDSIFLSNGFTGVTNFFFSTPAAVTPGVTYYFQPVVQSGDGWGTSAYNSYNYSGGMEFFQGAPFPNNDLWFREGIVPEPSAALLVLLGGGVLVSIRRAKRSPSHENKTDI